MRRTGLTVRIATSDLSSIAPGTPSHRAAGEYAPGQWVAATGRGPTYLLHRPKGAADFVHVTLASPPAAATVLELQRVVAHEWGHAFDDALAPDGGGTIGWHSDSERFQQVCKTLQPEFYQWYADRWRYSHRHDICREIFADHAARLALRGHETNDDRSGEYRLIHGLEATRKVDYGSSMVLLDSYFTELIAGISS